jgi:hypothetical protein
MARSKAIINQFDGSFPVSDKYDSKYFKYLVDIKDTGGLLSNPFAQKTLRGLKRQ